MQGNIFTGALWRLDRFVLVAVMAAHAVAGAAESMDSCPKPEALLRLANGGDRSAQFVAAQWLFQGSKSDIKSAVDLLQRAAEQGHQPSQVQLGVMFLEGKNVAKDPASAGKWFLRAAEQGNAEAQARLQVMYTEGVGVPKDRFEANQWKFATLSNREKTLTSIAAAVNSAPAIQGRGTIADYLPYAEQGSALAQYQVGRLYFDAPYGERDERLGLEWMTKAAQQGHIRAMVDVAKILAFGARGVEANQANAMEWFGAAAKQDFRLATAGMLEVSFRIGTGLTTEAREAKMFEWTKHMAELGSDDGQFRLGNMFAIEKGVARDYAQAAAWYQRAANQGNAEAQYELARLYVDGLGVSADVSKAYFWWALAIRGGRKGGALAVPGFWEERALRDTSKLDEDVRRWKPVMARPDVYSPSQLEKLCL